MPNVQKTVYSSAKISSFAVELAAKAGDDFAKQVEQTFEAKIIQKRSGLIWLTALQSIYQNGELDSFPVPGSQWDDDDIGDDMPDRYQRPAKNSAGDRQSPVGSFYVDWYQSTARGRELVARRQAMLDAKANKSGCDADLRRYVTTNPGYLEGQIKTIETRIESGAGFVRQAINLHRVMSDISEYLPDVGVMYVGTYDKAGNLVELADVTTPFRVFSKKPPHASDVYTIGQMLQFDPKAAADKVTESNGVVTELDALLATAKRGAEDTSSDAEEYVIDDLTSFDHAAASMANYFENSKNILALLNYLTKEDSDGVYLSIKAIHDATKGIVDKWEQGNKRSMKIAEKKIAAMTA